MYGFPRTRPSTRWRSWVRAIGLVNGSNKTFLLPEHAILGSVAAWEKSASGVLTPLAVTEDVYKNVVLGQVPTVNAYPNGGYYGSSDASVLVDGNTAATPFWSPAHATPIITWDLATPTSIVAVAAYTGTSSGFGGLSTYKVEYSDDNSAWTQLQTDLGTGSLLSLPATTARYWRIVGLSKGSYEWSVAETALYARNKTISSFTCLVAPASGSTVYLRYRAA